MKKLSLKRISALMLSALSLCAALTGCGGSAPSSAPAASGSASASAASSATGGKLKIGILQFAEHPSLDNCREGFITGMTEAGYEEGTDVEYEYQNAQADTATCQQIATSFVSSGVDMIVAIATPAAQAAFNVAEPAGIPTVYVAVSDPVGAQLVGENGESGKLVTGTSDLLPASKQLAMIREFLPDATKIGILFSTGEVNSEAQIKLYQEAAPEYGFEIVTSGIASTADVSLAAEALCAKTDCLTNLTDNTVVSALATVLDKAGTAGIPVFGSEVEQVKNGCLASEGLDYVSLGKQTAQMAARVLGGEDITKIPYETVKESSTDVNTTTLAKLGLTLPDSVDARANKYE